MEDSGEKRELSAYLSELKDRQRAEGYRMRDTRKKYERHDKEKRKKR